MIIEDLEERILIDPFRQGADKLKILSGYASASMARRHLQEIDQIIATELKGRNLPTIDVVYGMAIKDGVPLAQHKAFVEMSTNLYLGNFKCHYLVVPPPVHAKLYIWLKDDVPISAFIGSANYTQTAFLGAQIEAMDQCNEKQALDAFSHYLGQALECEHDDVDASVVLHGSDTKAMDHLDSVSLSFIVKNTGETPRRSGINWGQRLGRDHNQAYLRVSSDIAGSGFFPQRGEYFTVLTDDDLPMICVVAQDRDKAIHTVESNALIGAYIRKRIGVADGEYVTRAHFDAYGRTDVTVYKIDDETFYLDFSV